MDKEVSFRLDERVEIIGRIFQSVGISSVVWGVDALAHHAIFTIKEVIRTFVVGNRREMI